jgi:Ca2+/Na+ antiporter
MAGDFIFADLNAVAPGDKPYTEILVLTDGGADAEKSLAGAAGTGATAFSIKKFTGLLISSYAEFVWLFDLFGAIIAALTVLVGGIMIFMRRVGETERIKRLAVIGHTRSKEVRQNLFGVSALIFPFLALWPLILFALCNIITPVVLAAGLKASLEFNLAASVIGMLIFTAAVLLLEFLISFFMCRSLYGRIVRSP